MKKVSHILFERENGIYLPLFAILLLAILALLGAFAMRAYAVMVRHELQAAVDSAALAGANELCSTLDCVVVARSRALKNFAGHEAHGGTSTNDLAVDIPSDETLKSQYVFSHSEDRNLEITLETGRWLDSSFESFEGDWQANHKGIPAQAAHNALRVTARRPHSVLPTFLSGIVSGDLSASAIAVAALPISHTVPPLAVTACSLLDGMTAQLKPDLICVGDRIFAAPSNNPPAAPPMQALTYAPCRHDNNYSLSSKIQIDHQGRCTFPHGDGVISWDPVGTSDWAQNQFYLGERSWAVVGLPGFNGTPTQDDIGNAFTPDHSEYNQASIGMNFQIAPGPFNRPDLESAIWHAISDLNFQYPGSQVNAQESHPRAAEEIGTLDNSIFSLSVRLTGVPVFRPYVVWNPVGLCNSHRRNLRSININNGCGALPLNNQMVTASNSDFQAYWDPNTNSQVTDDTPVWVTEIPVIADRDSNGQCDGVGGAVGGDSVIDPSHHWEIIGFVKVTLFDVDIGHMGPGVLTQLPGYELGSPLTRNCVTNQGIGPPLTQYSFYVMDGAQGGWISTDLSYSGGTGSNVPCDSIRGRLKCGQSNMLLTGEDPYRQPRPMKAQLVG